MSAANKTLSEHLRERWADKSDAKLRRKMWRERVWCWLWFWGTPALVVAGLWSDWRFLFLTPFTVAFFAADAVTFSALRDELAERKAVSS